MISCANKILSRSNNILSRRNKLKNKTRMSLPGFRTHVLFLFYTVQFLLSETTDALKYIFWYRNINIDISGVSDEFFP